MLLGVIQTAYAAGCTATTPACMSVAENSCNESNVSEPVVNPYLASPLYAITHFDSSQSDSTP
ncbi:MAG TPA: hypothetical protein HA261_11335, partial [Methanosarcina sp.]|nr:hypothetical protein [Methanosarcina sp.]